MQRRKQKNFLYSDSVTGPNHLASLLPNQDAHLVGCMSEFGYEFLAASDGHGDKEFFRSNIGAQIAMDLIPSAIERFYITGADPQLLSHLIATSWKQQVAEHYFGNSFTNEEMRLQKTRNFYRNYGTTFAMIFFNDEHFIAVRNGDADLVMVSRDGFVRRIFESPFKSFTEAESLAKPDACWNTEVRTGLVDHSTKMFVVATDGLKDGLTNDASFDRVIERLFYSQIRSTQEEFKADLRNLLMSANGTSSSKGSGDDATIAVAVLEVEE